ncbi:hypothetical protein ACFS5L_25135 [Streptomyces phyllanthi]|uniref:Uncharacterized protein n=1 Tax=Streptomyces phyllanthi TaxID=1803180 RepID=A0A5N8VWC2_9ACTN|nr:hypothetical protein [Streptomyces phyllanthi]MPY39547.1 hypothetical protein [Streptomyces phyllanthi]
MTALLAGALTAPAVSIPPEAHAAEACPSSVATYVLEGGPGVVNPAKPRTLRKYLDWGPKDGDADGTIFDTGHTAPVPGTSRIFTAGNGVIYEITASGTLKSYTDETATGGSLLTPARTYGTGWGSSKKVWASGSLLFAQAENGEITVYKQSDPATGSGTISSMASKIPADHAAAVAIKNADDVWMADSKVYVLTDGEISTLRYFGAATGQSVHPRLTPPTVVATGLTDAVQAWSPGPGTVHTHTGSKDHSGTIKGYTGTTALTLANDEIRTGIYGQIFADTATCLADMAPGSPYFGTRPDDSEVPEATPEPESDPSPTGAKTVSGRFTRGDGHPVAGLEVVIEASDVLPEEEGATADLPTLGKTTTAADGSWSLTLPNTLPAEVQEAVDANGGAVNVTATATGVTSNGVIMQASDNLTAASESATSAARMAIADFAAEEEGHSVALLPQAPDGLEEAEPTAQAVAQSWASAQDQSSVDTLGDAPLPEWQSQTGAPPVGYNPYIVDGTDVSSMKITPYMGGCERWTKTLKKYIRYTTVAEGHANWDAYASVDYDEKLSTNVEVAVSTPGGWKIQGSVNLGSSTGQSSGYTKKGPYFAKQWKVPIKYKKIKKYTKCGGRTASHKEIRAGRYTVPAGGATGKYGKDVRYKDGAGGYYQSPKRNRAYIKPGAYFQLSKGRSVKWSAAVTVEGIALGASTQLDREHKQRITAGERTVARHDIWGANGPVSGKPGVLYSY